MEGVERLLSGVARCGEEVCYVRAVGWSVCVGESSSCEEEVYSPGFGLRVARLGTLSHGGSFSLMGVMWCKWCFLCSNAPQGSINMGWRLVNECVGVRVGGGGDAPQGFAG